MKAKTKDQLLKELEQVRRRLAELENAEAQRAQTEQLLRKLSSVVEQSADHVIITDTKGIIEYVNPAFERVTGYTKKDAIGTTPSILKSGKHDARFYTDLWRTILSGKVFRGVLINKKKDGSLYYEAKTITPLKDSQGKITHFVSTGQDITDQKRLQAQLLRSQRMEALGRLAGGVAHDFNNLVTAIAGYSEFLQRGFEADDPRRQDVLQIRKAAGLAASLTRQLLAFTRKQVLEPKVLDLNAVITDIEKLLRRLIGEDIDLTIVLASNLGFIEADATLLDQVIMNLAINARDAMPQGGKLTIETKNIELDKTSAREDYGIEAGSYVALSVSDTGTGMDAETRARIFDPFFTTKTEDEGTGLGLSTVSDIVKQCNGSIQVLSEPGKGTTFTIYLPRVEGAAEPFTAVETAAEPPRGSETILVVEDDDLVRRLTGRVLRMYGYTVHEARNGEEALEIHGRHRGPIHLLLCDVVMPQLSGPELASRLTHLHPEMKVLYMSGYAGTDIDRYGLLRARTPFLAKPFTPKSLARKVREVLDEAPLLNDR
jgi:PAS domain S-box-containing protein